VQRIVELQFEKIPEGVYLATSDKVPAERSLRRWIARDVARKPIEAQLNVTGQVDLAPTADAFDYPLIVGA
jgi:hypothetical protein